ncbi:MAG: leucine-rich repeat protein [Clostridia bacterium]|nr:leucine-rich repeat protein [Clostridia bacterium]
MKDNKFKRNWQKIALSALTVAFTLSAAGGLASCKEDEPENVPGLGFFYCDTETGENQLALGDNYKATFSIDGLMKEATYGVQGNVLTLTFADGSTATATMSSDSLMLTYNNGEYKFYKKVSYTVSYEEVGGSEVEDATVINGQTFAKPADPKKPGHEFLGWYTDSEYKNPYSFAQTVTGNITLYAQWAEVDPAAANYNVDFDLGYDGAEKLADMTTKSGKLYNVPTPEREGYNFCGWWISMYEDGTKLTYKYTDDTVFTANTTLFALWETKELGSKLSAPEVEVTENGVQWNGLTGVSRYELKITGPTGFFTIHEEVSGTSFPVNFANAPAGDYEITVTAKAQSGTANNADTVTRYYKNKAVGRVSQFTVIDGNRLLFNRVENAENYYITIDCGNDEHAHTTYYIGESTYYDFSACEMQEGGIKFTVTATADGYADTTSETFVYDRKLAKVEGLSVDEETQTLSWYSVENAANYIVTVTCGDATHSHKKVNVGTKTSFSLKECAADANGQIKVSVYAQTDGYNSAEATELVYEKTKLATPGNIKLVSDGVSYKLTWTAAADATATTKYDVKIGTSIYENVTATELDVTEFAWSMDGVYKVEIKAKDDTKESVWSDAVTVNYGKVTASSVKYKNGAVSWQPAVGATGYEVRVGSGSIQAYDKDVTSAPVTFTAEGSTMIGVRCVVRHPGETADSYSEWVYITVENIQTIQYYDSGKLLQTDYKVIGDKVNAPEPTKDGYVFAGWYTTSKGPANNGTKYDDEYFTGTSELVLYAYWSHAEYEIVYETGADGKMNETSTKVTYTKGYKFHVPTVEDGTKVFLGWFAGTDSGAQQLTDDRGYSLKNWSLKQGATVYAQYVSDVLEFTALENGTWSVSKGRNIHKVTTITIPEKYQGVDVTVVEGNAFEGRRNLVSITMPDTIQLVERDTAFKLCDNLQEINVYHVDGNNTAVYSSVDGVLLVKDLIGGQTQLAYYPLGKAGTYQIPEGVTEIPLNLFRESKITEVVIPTSVAIIRESAFRDCKNLTKVTFEENGTDTLTIEEGAFNNCTSLTEITLPSRLSEITLDEETRTITLFNGCEALQYINVERGSAYYSSVEGVLTNADKDVLLYCPAARTGSYTIPEGIVEVGERAFYNCSRLSEIIVPGYVEVVGDYAFYGCSGAAKIVFTSGAIGNMELTVGDYAFAEMTNLREVRFEEGSQVTTLGESVFANATGLRVFEIPATMTYIGDKAFDNASALKTITFAKNGADLTFGNYVFNDCTALEVVELPSTVVKLNLGVFDGCVNISRVEVDEENEYYKDIDGVVLSKDGKELLFFPKGRMTQEWKDNPSMVKEYVLPVGVESISDGAFKGTMYVEKMVIPNTVTYLGKGAFANCLELATLEFEAGNDTVALTIDEGAFEGCAKVQSVVLPKRTQVIEAKAFYNVSIRSIEFPSGITTIGDYAFSKSALTSVKIPAGLATLGRNVFESCVALTTVEFEAGFNAKEIPVGTFQASALKTIQIPASIEKIGYTAFNNCLDLTSVTFEAATADLIIGYLPEGLVEEEGDGKDKENEKDKGKESSSFQGVFLNCNKLGAIEIPDRTIYIGKAAFSGCSRLATVTINETSKLQRLGAQVFYGCTSLTSLYIPKTVSNTPFVNEQTAQEYAIGDEAFSNSAIRSLTFAKGGTEELSIGSNAFMGTSITTLDLPNRIAPIYTNGRNGWATYEGIGRNMFQTGLNSSGVPYALIAAINIEEGGQYYGSKDGVLYRVKDGNLNEMLFVPAAKTGSITVPATVTLLADNCAQYSLVNEIVWEDAENANGLPLTIGKSALTAMQNLKVVRFPERTVEIGANMFENASSSSTSTKRYSRVEEVYIPANVEKIGERMFYFCLTVKSVTFADGCKITEIPTNMFCTANASATLGNQLTSFRVPANVEKIGQYAFRGCKLLTKLDFEEGSKLTKLDGAIFEGMPLTELTIPDNVTDLNGNVFYKMTSLKVVNLPAGITNISTMGNNNQSNFLFEGCTALEAVNVSPENQTFTSVDGIVFTKDGKSLIYCPTNKMLGNEILNEDGTGTGTYDGNYTTPAGCQTIATYAFKGQKRLKQLTLSEDLLYINNSAFYSCTALNKLTFAERTSTLRIGDNAFYNCYGLGKSGTETLTIPETVEIDGSWAFAYTRYGKVVFEGTNYTNAMNRTFSNCTYLKEVQGTPVVLAGMECTFDSCTQLKSVTFTPGSRVESMKGTFYKCTALETVSLPSIGSMTVSAGKGVFESCTKLKTVTMEDCGFIGQDTFYGCTAMTSFEMPNGVSGMDVSAFQGCTNLTSIKLSSGLENIANKAFYNCSNLTSIEITGFVSSIGDSAFEGCSKLASVTLPDGLVSIGNRAFYNTKLVRELILPSTLETIGDYAFYGWSNIQKIDIPAKVTSIGAYAFSGCSSITELNLPEGAMLQKVGDYAFEGMSKLKAFFIPANLTQVGQGIFKDWDSLEEITVETGNPEYAYANGILYNATYTEMVIITPSASGVLKVPETVTSLAKGIFANLNITGVELPDTLKEIPDEAFRGCAKLETVKMPKYLQKIGEAAFEGCVSLKEIDIPASVHSVYEKTPFVEKGGIIFGYYTTEEYDGIGRYAFANCTSLAKVNFVAGGAQRLSFGDYAFYGCTSLTSISIPNRVRGDSLPSYSWYNPNGSNDSHDYHAQGIGAYAFARCTNLQSVVFEEEGVATFSEKLMLKVGAFSGCTNLQSVQFNSALGDIRVSIISEKMNSNYGAVAIHARAFEGCTALTDVKFADNYDFSKMMVVYNAFADCKSLKLPDTISYADASMYEELAKGDKVAFSYSCWADDNYQIYGCKWHGDKGQLTSCTFYDAYKYGITR